MPDEGRILTGSVWVDKVSETKFITILGNTEWDSISFVWIGYHNGGVDSLTQHYFKKMFKYVSAKITV